MAPDQIAILNTPNGGSDRLRLDPRTCGCQGGAVRRSLIALLTAVACLAAVSLSGPSASAGTDLSPASYQVEGSTQRIGHGALPGLRYVATAPMTARVGQKVSIRTWWRDARGTVYADLQDWGDLGIGSSSPPNCESGQRDLAGGSAVAYLTHRWSKAGTYAVRLQVTSGGCGVRKQTRTLRFTVVVS